MEKNDEVSPENYANWFALYNLCKYVNESQIINISSIEFGKILHLSQQTASRRINDLEELGWITRRIDGKKQSIIVTKKGADVMLKMYKNLRKILEDILIVGEVTEGIKEGGYYVAIKGYYDQFQEKLGFEPYKGTLNLNLNDTNISILREKLKYVTPIEINGFKDQNREYGAVHCYPCYLSRLDDKERKEEAAILDIKRTHHKKNIVEILAKPFLRDHFNLKDGDKVIIEFIKNEN